MSSRKTTRGQEGLIPPPNSPTSDEEFVMVDKIKSKGTSGSKGSKLEMPKSEDVKPKSPAPSIQLHKADRAPVVTETPESAKGKTVRDAKTESALIEQYWSSDEFAHYKRLKNLRQFLKETSRAYLNIPDKTVRALTPAEYTLLDTKLNLMDRCVEKVTNGEVPTLTADERDVIEQPCGKIVGLGGDIYRRGPMEKIKRWRG